MTNQTQLFEAALGIKAPWYVQGVDFGTELTIAVDFVAGSRFAYPGVPGEHPVHDTVIKRLRHLNFFPVRLLSGGAGAACAAAGRLGATRGA